MQVLEQQLLAMEFFQVEDHQVVGKAVQVVVAPVVQVVAQLLGLVALLKVLVEQEAMEEVALEVQVVVKAHLVE